MSDAAKPPTSGDSETRTEQPDRSDVSSNVAPAAREALVTPSRSDTADPPGGPPTLPPPTADPALQRLLVLPVRSTVVFPGTVVPLPIGREKTLRAVEAALAGDKTLAVIAQRREDIENPGPGDLYRVGAKVQILKLFRTPDGTSTVLVHGQHRVGLVDMVATEPNLQADFLPHEDQPQIDHALEALVHNARQLARDVIDMTPNVPDEAASLVQSIEKPGALADFLAANLTLGLPQKQELLETFDVAERLRKIAALLTNQLEILQLAQKLQADVRDKIDKTQRQYFLQEQLKAIQKELGEADPQASELDDLQKRVAAAQMPELVQKEAEREMGRLKRLPGIAPEAGVIRDYLEWLIAMPWRAETPDKLDLIEAERILNEDHYGLEKIKRRILEYLAVRKLNPTGRAPILCFVGPPGVGKTSLGQSIARAMGRKFIRIALGGVRDEADIRGHRRTYIGSIPGRIVQEIRKAGTNNPVIMLDELDKLASDFRGDPASALLEVLDPAQNQSFTDHYLSVPFDLSRVMFIGTANYLDPVAPALRDRMEVVELHGYTTQEKMQIARRYLIPRQVEQNGIKEEQIEIPDGTVRAIIEDYTREAGVRDLERLLGAVCRALAVKVAKGQAVTHRVEQAQLTEILGVARFLRESTLLPPVPGVVIGLAYTPVGGEIMFIEAMRMPGRGQFMLTGQIGDVMRESAEAALSLVRSQAPHWGIDAGLFKSADLHIHVPAGAIPKDGPSAGVAMFMSLFTLLTGRSILPRLAMTGEISLRGLVLPVGGIKEKVLAAHRAGVKTILLPARNKPDMSEIPNDVLNEVEFHHLETVDDAIQFTEPAKPRQSSKTDKTKAESDRARVRVLNDVGKASQTTANGGSSRARKPARERN